MTHPSANLASTQKGVYRNLAALCLLLPLLVAQEPTIKVDVDLVRLACSASDHGVPVKGLTQNDFTVTEDGQPQTIRYFWQESDLPLTVGLIVDASYSQATLIKKHKETLTRFLRQVLRPQDHAMLVTVGPQVRLLADFTSSADDLGRAIDHISVGGREGALLGGPCGGKHVVTEDDIAKAKGRSGRARRARRHINAPCGGTALWQGVYAAAHFKMRAIEGRKALIMLSDGWDTGSRHGLEEAIAEAQAAETPVYTVKFVSGLAATLFPVIAFKHPMEKLSEETGGVGYGMLHGDLATVFQQIESELRSQYVLAYTSSNHARDGAFRRVVVTSSRKDVKVRTKTGYHAPSANEAGAAPKPS